MPEPKKRKQTDNQEDKKKAGVKKSTDVPAEPEESRFGGLPDRDLKKNLGCGG